MSNGKDLSKAARDHFDQLFNVIEEEYTVVVEEAEKMVVEQAQKILVEFSDCAESFQMGMGICFFSELDNEDHDRVIQYRVSRNAFQEWVTDLNTLLKVKGYAVTVTKDGFDDWLEREGGS